MRLVDAIAVIGAARQVTVAITRWGVREDCASDDVTARCCRWINWFKYFWRRFSACLPIGLLAKKYIPVTQITLKLVRLPVWCTICFSRKNRTRQLVWMDGYLRLMCGRLEKIV